MAIPRTIALFNRANIDLRKILAKLRKSVLVLTVYVWKNRHDSSFWEQIRAHIKRFLAANYKRIIIEGLIPPLCVYLKYAKITVILILLVAVIVYSLRSVLRPMLIVIHDELGKIADFMDKVAYWLARGYFAPYPYIGLMLVSGIGLEILTIILQNPLILNLLQQRLAQMSSGPRIALRLLQSTPLGLLKLLPSIQPPAWGDRLLVYYQHTWYQKSAAILAIGLRLPALQTLGSVPEATLQLLPSIPPRALAEGFSRFLWIEHPWYQKPAMLAIGLPITSLTIRRIMRLCILTHNNLYYPYVWLANPSRYLKTALGNFFSWISKASEN